MADKIKAEDALPANAAPLLGENDKVPPAEAAPSQQPVVKDDGIRMASLQHCGEQERNDILGAHLARMTRTNANMFCADNGWLWWLIMYVGQNPSYWYLIMWYLLAQIYLTSAPNALQERRSYQAVAAADQGRKTWLALVYSGTVAWIVVCICAYPYISDYSTGIDYRSLATLYQ